ncbi:MAG: hypothetical protein V1908_04700 [Candidatus Peregrinibacteria bacterium]
MNPNREHIRRHAHRHHKRYLKLRELLKYAPAPENVWPIFLKTVLIALIAFGIYSNWGRITDALTPEPLPPPPQTHGFKTGMKAAEKVNEQAGKEYLSFLTSVRTFGSLEGVKGTWLFGHRPKVELAQVQGIVQSIKTTTDLSTGQFLTTFPLAKADGSSKSVLATYYLGEKTDTLTSTLQNDAKLLGQMNNALSVDLFAYLNQSPSRADALQGYLNLLKALQQKTNLRISQLGSVVTFLFGNSQAQETQIQASEQKFFEQLSLMNGPNAEEELSKFVGLQSDQTEIRAKLGAYQSLKNYYLFFAPKLDNLIQAIEANRDALIAGVKVTEIQNITLPLILRQK